MENPIDFSKRSRRAIFIFLVFFIVIVLIPRVYSFFQTPSEFNFTQTDFEKKMFKQKQYTRNNFYKKSTFKSKFKTPPKKFDPNTYSPSDWMLLGMSQKQADLIIKFGKRGFYTDEDLKKVFVISDKFFAVIKDSLFYPEKPEKVNFQTLKSIKENIKFELNTASEEDLLTIKGIGAFYAKNIIKKRDELGGFISKNQLLEIWKFDEEKLANLEPFITVDYENIVPLKLNTITAEELKKHPYIWSWNIANSIVKIRTQLGGFQKIEDIKRSVLIDEELFSKLKPYLSL